MLAIVEAVHPHILWEIYAAPGGIRVDMTAVFDCKRFKEILPLNLNFKGYAE